MKRVATHRGPDPDAIVSAWLAERYLFLPEEAAVEVVFVARTAPRRGYPADIDCLVDVGNEYDPARLRFDHKPPAFADRNEHCATSLVWDHLRRMGRPVEHLASLVRAVHQGDRQPPGGRPGPELAESRERGFHAHFARIRPRVTGGDAALYAVLRLWLDEYAPVSSSGYHATGNLRGGGVFIEAARVRS